MMALNEIMGEQHRLLLDFVAGAGFVGIAVALMGRSHPVGIVLAAILFGVLYQGGAELAFDDAHDHARHDRHRSRRWSSCSPARWRTCSPAARRAVRLFRRPAPRAVGEAQMDSPRRLSCQLLDSTHPPSHAAAARLPRRPLFRARRHLRHRARRQDAGRRLRRRPRPARSPARPGSGSPRPSPSRCVFALSTASPRSPTAATRSISGVAINFLAVGPDRVLGQAWFQQGGQTPPLPDAGALPADLPCPSREAVQRRAGARADLYPT